MPPVDGRQRRRPPAAAAALLAQAHLAGGGGDGSHTLQAGGGAVKAHSLQRAGQARLTACQWREVGGRWAAGGRQAAGENTDGEGLALRLALRLAQSCAAQQAAANTLCPRAMRPPADAAHRSRRHRTVGHGRGGAGAKQVGFGWCGAQPVLAAVRPELDRWLTHGRAPHLGDGIAAGLLGQARGQASNHRVDL